MVCEIADEGDHFGKRVWHNVVWIPRGSGEKANPGHGMAVHFLRAVGLPFDGKFRLAESDLKGRSFRVLLGVTTYDKVVDGRTYTNEKNFIEELYTESHPEPDELPAPRTPRKGARQTPTDKQVERPGAVDEEPVPF
ncbi:MAG: hypothetical protein AUJ52_14925 [Elusimicrobia bacterium CG1_02_63_36]|nr:MAG: hypothetical protein AUJ52_14925 [Elusimicrobia bacterium CG1_02_63_36]PIP82863.1 MAG: hypothetical protein COR54_12665 [Elusimicrobia bacterium CG22_combo_CG10-13_8_21_14_all_63_91]PJA18682.1 MAG: hypothetical protein COX66_00245 [Elusimicrobia bacterium CG_4_10_14_0_2_um_filter_63_34]PJB24063.1 MAG: hypothetical protein CO113_15890 [Elusimicrobia bacterium CG_4_9_14_3_um_filter_62_55]